MHLFKTLLAGAALVASAAAGQGRLRFTSFTPSVEVGDPVTVTWAGGSDAPVTLKLRKGPSTNLEDVAVLTSSGTGGSYTWIPETTLPEGTNYALQIDQGEDVNYTGQFAIKGGAPNAPPNAPPTTTAATVPTTPVTSAVTSDASSYSPVSPTSSESVSESYSTPSSSIVTSATSTIPLAPTPSGDDSSSTLTVHPSGSPTGSGTTTAAAPTATGGAASMASPLALVLGIVAAVVYLN